MSDEPRSPSEGLVPDFDDQTDPHRLGDEMPDTFDAMMESDSLENELPEEGVSPEDVAFEQDLETSLEQDAVTEEG